MTKTERFQSANTTVAATQFHRDVRSLGDKATKSKKTAVRTLQILGIHPKTGKLTKSKKKS